MQNEYENEMSLESMRKGLFVPVSLAHHFNDNQTLQFETFLLWIGAEMRLIISFRFWFCFFFTFYHINYQKTTSNCQTKTTSTTTGLLKTGILKMVQSQLGIQLAAVTVPEVPHATVCLEHLLSGLLYFFLFFLLLFFHDCDQLRRGKRQQKNRPFITYSWRWN